MDKFSGIKYTLHSSENFDEYLKELGVSSLVRSVFMKLRPSFQVFVNGDAYRMVFGTPVSSIKLDFKLNEQFEYVLPNFQKVYVTVQKESDDTLIEYQNHDDKKMSKIIRKFYLDRALMTYITGNVTAKRLYLADEEQPR
ncbi:fatty acid-binding protein-like isoform X3 [Cimex lectularius]|uniref:Cytosolic fatty-acid binding proteins domain-containing protein n=1 Tax=Cimex lectularius TaxID=79782 RepID=A0A8I6RNS0_CIMLE|nr:fatty acid-binding protein-like isoform X3 [Cimex lectularius]XP_014248331.1 fatty acid-binding protein-like isoform X3 [Cimex lectularius]XP_014248332.1 fatty acid-binding protein-like isoform X3 [Cimex lectularius]XP_014248333.1 fatty acid-binding protein-like isoform X3 [Cimex lectularius]